MGSLLIQLLGDFPSLVDSFSDSGVELLILLLEPRNIHELMQASRVKRSQVFKKIKQGRSISLVRKADDKYSLNEKLWTKAIDFLKEVKKYQEIVDTRVPAQQYYILLKKRK